MRCKKISLSTPQFLLDKATTICSMSERETFLPRKRPKRADVGLSFRRFNPSSRLARSICATGFCPLKHDTEISSFTLKNWLH